MKICVYLGPKWSIQKQQNITVASFLIQQLCSKESERGSQIKMKL